MSVEQVGVKTPEYVSLKFRLAGLGSRSAAFMIDQGILLLFNLLLIIFSVIILSGDFDTFLADKIFSGVMAVVIIVYFLVNFGYFIVLEFFWGGKTIGKRVVGIRVIQENGHSITLLGSFIRNFLRLIDMLPTGYLVGLLMIFFHSKHKRLGDIVAGTIVVHERKPRKKRKQTAWETEIKNRGLSADSPLQVEDWAWNSLQEKEWKLLRAYSQRFPHLPIQERVELTKQVADIILPKLDLDRPQQILDMENLLFVIYLRMAEEWEYDL